MPRKKTVSDETDASAEMMTTETALEHSRLRLEMPRSFQAL